MAEQRTVHTTDAEYLATLETLERLRAERDRYREALESTNLRHGRSA